MNIHIYSIFETSVKPASSFHIYVRPCPSLIHLLPHSITSSITQSLPSSLIHFLLHSFTFSFTQSLPSYSITSSQPLLDPSHLLYDDVIASMVSMGLFNLFRCDQFYNQPLPSIGLLLLISFLLLGSNSVLL